VGSQCFESQYFCFNTSTQVWVNPETWSDIPGWQREPGWPALTAKTRSWCDGFGIYGGDPPTCFLFPRIRQYSKHIIMLTRSLPSGSFFLEPPLPCVLHVLASELDKILWVVDEHAHVRVRTQATTRRSTATLTSGISTLSSVRFHSRPGRASS
jgi:hypothetical protein